MLHKTLTDHLAIFTKNHSIIDFNMDFLYNLLVILMRKEATDMNKRILSILIVLAVLIGVSVLSVSAAGETRTQCECGGTAVGKYDHTCQNITYQPWTEKTSLPASGNYYLTDDVTVPEQQAITGTLRLDLNGKDITRKVSATTGTQVFSIGADGLLVITDSTDNPGTVSRDLSALSTADAEAITNWGLLFYLPADSSTTTEITDALSLYNGIFDATGQYSGGGSIISNSGLYSTVNIYGGELRGGITKGVHGAIYSVGHVNMFGGKLSGGVAYTTNQKSTGGIHITVTPSTDTQQNGRYLTLSGDAQIIGNYRTSDGVTYEDANTRVRWGQLYMKGTFTGCASFTLVDSYQNIITDPLTATHALFYNGGTNVNTFDISDGAILIDNQPDQGGVAKNGQIWATTTKNQCECGGKAEGKYGHTCKTLNFLPWTSTTSLPSDGNYYLTDTVTTTKRTDFGSGKTVRLDLNGNDIVRSVTATKPTTSIFGMTSSGATQLTITDSTATVGTVTRDLSTLDEATQASINNYGLLMFVRNITGGGMTIYDGIYDFDGAYCDSSSVIYNASANSTINIHGGNIHCGITPTAKEGAIYSNGPVGLYGGRITGAKVVSESTAAIEMGNNSSMLTISGDVEVTGNSRVTIASDGTITAVAPANIFAKPAQVKFAGTFTGNVGISPVSGASLTTPTSGMQIGVSDNAVLSGTVTIDGYKEYTAKVSGTKIVLCSSYAAITDHGMNTYTYDSLAAAIENYPGGEAVIRLGQDCKDTVTIPQTMYIDLDGCDIAGVSVNEGATLYLFDGKTNDYTIDDGDGYGKIGTISGKGTVSALPDGTAIARDGYLMITEADGTSFHRLNLDTVAISLRASDVGLYYQSQFGGDEVIKRNIKAYGTAMGAGQYPSYKDKTYTRIEDMTSWIPGMDVNGNSNNLGNGVLLKDIMTEDGNTNKANAATKIYSCAYIVLLDGTRIQGNMACYSLKDVFEGATGLTGVDARWDTFDETTQAPIVTMFETFERIMRTWNIPRIKATVNGGEVEDTPYEDDGILKVLLIGHSLGLDSGFFFPEVYKEETGKDMVLGMLYHSGCPLYNHVNYLNSNAKQYAYYEFDTSKDVIWRRAYADGTFHTVYPGTGNDTLIADGTIGVTMQFGIKQADWDLVITQAGVWEVAGKGTSSSNATITSNIQTIRNYVIAQDIEKRSTPEFGWNITWAPPSEESGLLNESYLNNFTSYFDCDTDAMFTEISRVVQEAVVPAGEWKHILPSGTALHNAKTVMADTDLYRDTVHASDFGRLMIAYTWLCKIEGISIEDCDITSIHYGLRYKSTDRNSKVDYSLTTTEKANLKKFVKAALETPYAITDCSK